MEIQKLSYSNQPGLPAEVSEFRALCRVQPDFLEQLEQVGAVQALGARASKRPGPPRGDLDPAVEVDDRG